MEMTIHRNTALHKSSDIKALIFQKTLRNFDYYRKNKVTNLKKELFHNEE